MLAFNSGEKGKKAKGEKLPHIHEMANGQKGERLPVPLQAVECLAIEDAPAGVRAAHAAGMKCLALAHSRPLEALQDADWACREFADVDLEKIRVAFGQL